MHPQDPPPYPEQPGRPPPYPQYPSYPQHPQYPPTQAYPPYPARSPYPVGARQYPGHGYPQPPHQPPRRTEFGWASIVVASIALLTCWVPYFNIVAVVAAVLVVLAGWLGRHERSRIPTAFGTGITALALIGTVAFTLLWRAVLDWFSTWIP